MGSMAPARRFAVGLIVGTVLSAALYGGVRAAVGRWVAGPLGDALGTTVAIDTLEISLHGVVRLRGVSASGLGQIDELDLFPGGAEVHGLSVGSAETPVALPAVDDATHRGLQLLRRLRAGNASATQAQVAEAHTLLIDGSSAHVLLPLGGLPVRVDVDHIAAAPDDAIGGDERLLLDGLRITSPSGVAINVPEVALSVPRQAHSSLSLPGGAPLRAAAAGIDVSVSGQPFLHDLSLYLELQRTASGSASLPTLALGRLHAETDDRPLDLELTRQPDGSYLAQGQAPGLPLTALSPLFPGVLDPRAAAVSGDLQATVSPTLDDASFSLEAQGTGFSIDSRLVGPRPLADVDAALSASGRVQRAGDGWSLALDSLMVSRGRASVTARGTVVRPSRDRLMLAGTVTLAPAGCADLLASLPAGLAPDLDDLDVGGTLAGELRVAIDTGDPTATTLSGHLDDRCHVLHDAPAADVAALKKALASATPVSITVSDGHGGRRQAVIGGGTSGYIALAEMPDALRDAFIASEDARFEKHGPFDLSQIQRAVGESLEAGRPVRGASTITQQLARTLYLSPQRSLSRKLEEAVLAWRLDQALGKARVLELYLNLIELGDGVYGVDQAARHYFGKSVAALSPLECAFLASMAPAPRTYSRALERDGLTETVLGRVDEVLSKMQADGAIASDAYARALHNHLAVVQAIANN
jgi:hypothetical protein